MLLFASLIASLINNLLSSVHRFHLILRPLVFSSGQFAHEDRPRKISHWALAFLYRVPQLFDCSHDSARLRNSTEKCRAVRTSYA